MTVFDYIIKNKLPLSISGTKEYIIVNCHAWDIQEVDDMLRCFNGVRIGFDVKINMEDIWQKNQ